MIVGVKEGEEESGGDRDKRKRSMKLKLAAV